MEKFLWFEEFSFCFLEDIWRLEEELQQLKVGVYGLEEGVVFKDFKVLEELQRQIEGLGVRFQYVEDGVYLMQVVFVCYIESLELFLFKSQEYE